MNGISFTERLARAASRHPKRTLAAWGGAVVLSIAATGAFLPSALTTEIRLTNDPESQQADALIDARLPDPTGNREIVIVRSGSLTMDDERFQSRVDELADEVRGLEGVTSVLTHEDAEGLISSDEDTTLLVVALSGTEEEAEGYAGTLVDLAEETRGDEIEAYVTGDASSSLDQQELSQHDLKTGELFFGAPAALVILLLVFGAVVAASIPLLLGVVSIGIAMGIVSLIGQFGQLSFFVTNMVTAMGLALGIDYTLFVLSRFREERGHGEDKLDAIAIAGATASRAVFFSGLTFVIALVGMLLVPLNVLRSLAAGAIIVGVIAVIAALTLLPALLSLLGDRVNRGRVPIVGRGAERTGSEGRFWSWAVHGVMRRPVVSLLLVVALLVAAAYPLLDIRIGAHGIGAIPDRYPSKQGFNILNEEFPDSTATPVLVVVDGDVGSPATRAAIDGLEARLDDRPPFGTPDVRVDESRDIAVLTVPIGGDPIGRPATDAVRELRDEMPAIFDGTNARALVGGETALRLDYFTTVREWIPIVIVIVLALSFLLLMLAFRSVVVPLKAILLNLLSVGAAYGLLVLVFQKGVGADLLGLTQVDSIEAWVPLFLFSVLFGLSMDYHVFLLSRIRERFNRTGDNAEAVAYGVGSTARLITGAALIIMAVFTGFALGDFVMFQQMGFGVGVALLIDATIIRSVLVPSSMKLLGAWNWYLPSWLEWLPEIGVEGERPPDRAPGTKPA